MRKRIRLTGRKQLPKNCIQLKVLEVNQKRMLTMDIANKKPLKPFPKDARLKIKLSENKVIEVLEFGTVGSPATTSELKNSAFSAPSCQLRIVSPSSETAGLLLGSTDTWTLKADNENQGNADRDGILLFQPKSIAPRVWKLDIRSDDFPIVYVDEKIPDPRVWVKNDPVFVSSVFPVVIEQVFEEILKQDSPREFDWMAKWLQWADTIMPGTDIPLSDDIQKKQEWTDRLIESFCDRHSVLDLLLDHLGHERYS